MERSLEIMAPAGNFECLHAAIQGGADSVYFGVEKLQIEYKVNNEWITAACGVYKPAANAVFNRFIALEKDPAAPIREVRLTAFGLGGIGINYIEFCVNGKHYVPRCVVESAGKVSDPLNLLKNNTSFAWFGGQSTRYDYFDRNAAEQKNIVTLEMQEFSADNIAMAKRA